ncbi:MAG: hypothetical protein A2845_04730 [Candidatus Lloydbacteria bacterium RIFCSPHIGHO2_01_FULL_49_22]|uniref:FAD/NAD(P)-binding domain-containing protein n=1 Tax=Candidatus Lloydbacteria bacterium RIFCSPHIGHO2_01_FULL_49_22 TaxID=1798658 RepID=A0A1G2CW81_9BACT|nr:MAG: hypothetical protein A2845_04730 [Candidatus Lloydbacteria bacterium RIFCSPHIGHO2_01_FULL_49_22]OGZ10118.1 MAG: hypothetical protein A3C14_00765 [Candidatus Lloydbacteria bacterium RIFCSPHIGHO2_02_FULL_50_18]
MQSVTYLIVGGGIAGTTAAEELRKRDKEGSITILTDEAHRLYSRVLLSKPSILTGEKSVDTIWMKSPEWYKTNNITLLTSQRAVALDAGTKMLTVSNGEIFHYDKLLLATGTHNRAWGIPGADLDGVFYLRTLDHAMKIIADLNQQNKHAVIVGSSCVTYEVADVLYSKGIKITEVMREAYFWEPSISREESGIVEDRLLERGVTIMRNMEIVKVLGDKKVEGVILKDGTHLECDMVFAFIGTEIPTEWLISSGIALDRGILANEYLETSLPDVWVAGDTARYKDMTLDDSVVMGNWMNAQKQGKTAAANMLGDRSCYDLVSFHLSHGFEDTIAFAGDGRMKENREYIMRGNAKERKLGRIILRGGRVIGASMINRTLELAPIVSLIAARADVSTKKAELADPNFDLKSLLPAE